MNPQLRFNLSRISIFLPFVGAIVALAWWLMNSQQFADIRPSLAIGSSVDMVILIPAVYFLLIRKTTIPNLTVIPITVLSFVVAYQIIPSDFHQTLGTLEMVLAPVELLVIGWLVYNVRKIIKGVNQEGHSLRDFPEVLKSLLLEKELSPTLANVVSSETSLFYYSFLGWSKAPRLKSNEFESYKASNYATIFVLVLFLLPVETLVLHYWLSSFCPVLAWILTAISIYSVFFILGDRNGIRHRPTAIQEDGVQLTTGIRWNSFIPFELIEKIELREADEIEEKFANLSPFGPGNVMIILKEKIQLSGIYGITKSTDRISLCLDRPQNFQKQVLEQLTH